MGKLKGKVILVTGGCQGLGKAICETLEKERAIVIPGDIQKDKIQKTKNACFLDVSNEENIENVINETRKRFGRLDVLINNAGIDVTKPFQDLSTSQWDRVLTVNLRGPFLMAKHAFKLMQKQGSGHIVNITSTASKRAWANASVYHASKWGLLGLSHAMLVDCREYNIKVTAVVAGGMKTPFILDRFPNVNLKNLQDPKNVAETIKFILTQPKETVIPEIMVLPFFETSWP